MLRYIRLPIYMIVFVLIPKCYPLSLTKIMYLIYIFIGLFKRQDKSCNDTNCHKLFRF